MISRTYRRYIWLLNLLQRSAPLSFDEVATQWEDAPENSKGEKLSLRTFHDHRKAIEEMFGITVACKRNGWDYVYYVQNPEALEQNEPGRWLLRQYSVPQDFATYAQMRDRVMLEEMAKGAVSIREIIEAMQRNVELTVDYDRYGGDRETLTVQPYALRVYARRWYLLGRVEGREGLRHLGVERMREVQLTDRHFSLPADFDVRRYYRNVVGIYVDENLPVEKIRIRVYGSQVERLRRLPLHPSQREGASRHGEFAEFTYRLCRTRDLTTLLLSMGDSVEVLEPVELREEIKEKLRETLNRYDRDI